MVDLSTTESEYMALTEGIKEVLWLKVFLEEFGVHQEQVVMFCDSQSTKYLTKNKGYHEKIKYIDVILWANLAKLFEIWIVFFEN